MVTYKVATICLFLINTNETLYLCFDKAGFINGENICIDGGMTHQRIYHADNGWTLSAFFVHF